MIFSKNQAFKTTNQSTTSKQGFFEQSQSIEKLLFENPFRNFRRGKRSQQKIARKQCFIECSFRKPQEDLLVSIEKTLQDPLCLEKSWELSTTFTLPFQGKLILLRKRIGTSRSGQLQMSPPFGGYVLELLESFSSWVPFFAGGIVFNYILIQKNYRLSDKRFF